MNTRARKSRRIQTSYQQPYQRRASTTLYHPVMVGAGQYAQQQRNKRIHNNHKLPIKFCYILYKYRMDRIVNVSIYGVTERKIVVHVEHHHDSGWMCGWYPSLYQLFFLTPDRVVVDVLPPDRHHNWFSHWKYSPIVY
jgi:hypothetical protein